MKKNLEVLRTLQNVLPRVAKFLTLVQKNEPAFTG